LEFLKPSPGVSMAGQHIGVKSWVIRSAKDSPEAWLIGFAIALGTAIKLWLDIATIGTNDVAYWFRFAHYIIEHGTITIYRDIPYYNHPPLVSSALWALGHITAQSPRLFPVFLRLPAILADVGSTVLLWKLASLYLGRRAALIAVSLFALNPVLVMVSGFHGNTDPVFIFLVLLGAYALLTRGSWMIAALCIGLAINIKIVPVITVPAFFFWIPTWPRRIKFLAVVGLIVLAGFGYHLMAAFSGLWRNIFSYSGIIGIWGLGRIFMPLHQTPPPFSGPWFPVVARYGMLGLIILSAILKGFRAGRGDPTLHGCPPGQHLLKALGWAFLIFLIAAPGFGVQYLSWLVGPGIFLGTAGLLLYTVVASVFLFRVYTFWSGGFPWYFADSDVRGQWVGVDRTLDMILWLLLVSWGAFHVIRFIGSWKNTRRRRNRTSRKVSQLESSETFDAKGRKIAVFVIAYNAKAEIEETLARIPAEVRNQISELFVVDDCSPDQSYEAALRYKALQREHRMTVLRNSRNQGYGGNQKIGYQYALSQGHDIVVMLHADGQYAPEVMAALLKPLVEGKADMVFGTRMAKECRPIRGGLPLHRFLVNRALTAIENVLTGMRLSEFHSGYRAYDCLALERLPLSLNSNSWHFDTEILLEFHAAGLRIAEVAIPTYYGTEIGHVNGMLYAIHCIRSAVSYRLTRWGLWQDLKYKEEAWKRFPYEVKKGDPFSSQSIAVEYAAKHPVKRRLLEIGPGSGAITEQFVKLGYEVTVVEANPLFAGMAGRYAARVLNQDIEVVEWNSLPDFDVVVLADILEHLRDPLNTLQKCVDHLAPGGRVVITLPNAAHWSVRLELLLGRFNYRPRGIFDQSHLRFFTRGSAEAMIRAAGLRIMERRAIPLPLPLLIPVTREDRFLAVAHVLNHIFTQSWRSLLAYQWAFECEAASGVQTGRCYPSPLAVKPPKIRIDPAHLESCCHQPVVEVNEEIP
jgi:glycosyltransferase involved in cell wall biosynthesis